MVDTRAIPPCFLLLIVAAAGSACGGLDCPKGYTLKGETCYRSRDGGAGDAGEPDTDASSGASDARTDSGRPDDANVSSMDSDTQEPPESALAEEGSACAVEKEQTLACDGHASSKALKCDHGTWALAQTCGRMERCDSRVGTEQGKCSPVPAACLDKQPGDVCDGTVRVSCGVDLVTVTTKACPSHSHCTPAGAVHCECDVGWPEDGQGTCTNDDDCPANACAGGTCVDGLDDYSCDCPEGYAGTGTKECTKVDYCPKNACTPGGTCVDEPDWSCQCNSGFSGTGTKACTNINDCPASACNPPGGTCEDGVNDFSCECNPGYSGDDCENDICAPNPCRNGGTCSRTGTLCACAAGFSGTNCQVDACNPSPCQHGGTCSGTAQGASCNCADTGYTGPTCQTDVDECSSANSCNNAAYPCVQSEAPGYTCSGQFADWSMPDAVAGSKTKPSYDVNSAPGATIDNVTGLMWQRDLPLTYSGCSGATSTPGDSCVWAEAKNYCLNLSLAGHTDWRLPSKIELESIADDTRSTPAIDPVAFPNTPPVNDGGTFWSGSPHANGTDNAWAAGSNGTTLPGSIANALRVRCVRGGRAPSGTPATRYTINGNSNVTDNRTGLIWQRVLDGNTYTLDGAKSYCASLGSGWRVPTKKELLTLVDVARAATQVPIDPIAFPNTPAESFRTATEGPSGSSTSALQVTFALGAGYAFSNPKSNPYRVRCVR